MGSSPSAVLHNLSFCLSGLVIVTFVNLRRYRNHIAFSYESNNANNGSQYLVMPRSFCHRTGSGKMQRFREEFELKSDIHYNSRFNESTEGISTTVSTCSAAKQRLFQETCLAQILLSAFQDPLSSIYK